jgi:hypothetical protein
MTTVAPPGVPPTPPTPPTPPPATATVASPPPSLTQLPIGTRLDATVVLADTGRGQVQIQTTLGHLTLQTPLALPKDAQLVLQVLALVPQVQLAITSVDGKSPLLALGRPATPAPGTGGGAATGAPAGGPAAGAATVTLTAGATVSATLIRPGPAAVATPQTATAVASLTASHAPTAAPGTPVSPEGGPAAVRIRSAAAVPGRETAAPAPTPSALPGRGGPGPTPTTASPAPEGRAAPLPAGVQFAVRIVAIQPPAPGSPPPTAGAALALGQTLSGTVVGSGPAGQPVVQTPAGLIAFATRAPLPNGTGITFQLTSAPTVPAAVAAPTAPEPLLRRDWPALNEALRALADADPVQRQHVLNTVLPRADSSLAAGILLFLAALRGGEVSSWLGEGPVRALQRAKPELADKLDGDFRQLARLAGDSGTSDWRVALIPVNVQSEIQQVRLLLRRQGGEEETKGQAGAGSRFVIDVTLSRLGRLQLDGLVRDKGKRMDLIVRTSEPLPQPMREDIHRLFAEANAATGIGGSIAFQAAPAGFVEIPAESVVQGHVGLIV